MGRNILLLLLVVACTAEVRAFSHQPAFKNQRRATQTFPSQGEALPFREDRGVIGRSTKCFAKKKKAGGVGRAAPPPSRGDFEYEELKAQMKAMAKAKLRSDDLTDEKRQELQGYLISILQKRPSLVPMKDVGEGLPGTSWRLSFSTQGFTSVGLPRDATVYVDFAETGNSATYSLRFGQKTFGLKNLKAACEWSCGTDETAMDPTKAGVVTLTYGEITTDVFGFSNLGVGLFGLLQGRSNYIQSVYFDGTVWIEEGYGPGGEQYYNVYLRDEQTN